MKRFMLILLTLTLIALLILPATSGTLSDYADTYTYSSRADSGGIVSSLRNESTSALIDNWAYLGTPLQDIGAPVTLEGGLPLPMVTWEQSRPWYTLHWPGASEVVTVQSEIHWSDGTRALVPVYLPAPSTVPEPGGFLALVGGVGSLLLVRRRGG